MTDAELDRIEKEAKGWPENGRTTDECTILALVAEVWRLRSGLDNLSARLHSFTSCDPDEIEDLVTYLQTHIRKDLLGQVIP